MRKRFVFIIGLFFLFQPYSLWARHIVGGELNYRYLGNNQYLVILKLYRDCNSATQFDSVLNVAAYEISGQLANYVTMHHPVISDLKVNLSNPCLIAPPNVCVQEADYQGTITLPPVSGGYDLVYQRCCRNLTITNLDAPGSQGATFVAHIPDPTLATVNSNPSFNNYPPLAICADEQLTVDGSATDLDGDSLAYSLCSPLQGADSLMPAPNIAPPPPYDSVVFISPFNSSQPLGDPAQLAINHMSGELTVDARFLGQYVVGICVNEYRNGNLLSSHVRDFQFNVVACNKQIEANFNLQNSIAKGDTLVLCNTRQAVLTNLSTGTSSFTWHFRNSGIELDSTNTANPSFTFSGHGLFEIQLIAGPGLICCDTLTKWLRIDSLPSFEFTAIDTCGNHGNHFTATPNGNAAGLIFNWDFGDGANDTSGVSVSHQYQNSGSYSVTVTMKNTDGCSAVATQRIPVQVNLARFSAPNFSTFNDSILSCNSHVITFSNQSDNQSIKWFFGTSSTLFDSSLNQNVSETFPSAGSYRAILITGPGSFCSDTLTRWVLIDSIPLGDFQSQFNCTSRYTLFNVTGVPPNKISSVSWKFGDGSASTDGFNAAHKFARPGIYDVSVTLSDIRGCSAEEDGEVEIDSLGGLVAGMDTTIRIGESIQLFAHGIDSVIWIPPTYLNDPFSVQPIATPLQDITYLVRALDTSQCYPEAFVTLRVNDESLIAVPNAFTPNGDGINDYLQFYAEGVKQFLEIAIFDRWGNEVFFTTDPTIYWDGKYKGKYCETGSYAYYLKALQYDGKQVAQRGMITLIR